MRATEIASMVTESASRFGGRNPQQFKQLCLYLGKAPNEEVAKGLIQVFTEGPPPPVGSEPQELAGKLLVTLCPKADFNLHLAVRASLPRYELSVEQFPEYLCTIFGKDSFLSVLDALENESLPEEERRALSTLRFWARNMMSS